MRTLRKESTSHHVLIWVYTLMTNHIHTIVVPKSETSLAETFRNTHAQYGHWYNRKYSLSGHVWEARFYSCPLDEAHLWSAVRYVERNPVRAGLVNRAEDYRWSSARAHVYGEADPMLDPGLPMRGLIGNWGEWLATRDVPGELEAIRSATAHDLPLCDEATLTQLEKRFGRPLRLQKRGRKSESEKPKGKEQGSLGFEE